jgi:alkylation response protein AidB-like acyl-CoA dehydrogenase
VTASVDSHCQLFLVDLGRSGVSVVPDSWPAVGMAGSDTLDVRFDEVDLGAESAVGARDFYLNRPGFWHGALGVAAVWWGGARAVARPLLTPKDGASPHRLAHAGAVRARLWSTEGTLEAAARRVDEDPSDLTSDARALAGVVRHVVETAATEVLDRVGRATGAEPLGHDAAHARRVADLTVYLRQSHAEADLAVLEGHFLAGGSLRGWT